MENCNACSVPFILPFVNPLPHRLHLSFSFLWFDIYFQWGTEDKPALSSLGWKPFSLMSTANLECCSHQASYWLTLFTCSHLFSDVTGGSNQLIYKFIDMVPKWWFRGIIKASRCSYFVAVGSNVMDLISCIHIQLDCISQLYCCVTNHPKTLTLTTILCYYSHVSALPGCWLL